LSTLSLLNNRSKDSKSTTARINRNSKLFKTIIRAIQEKKGENIISLDLRKIPEAVSDFFIICEAGSTTQVKAVADHVEHLVKKECGEMPYRHEGMNALQWVLVDYVNVVVHIFHPETRKFYRLEEMWSDAAAADHE
jgi:ribosome-associated protein